MPPLITLEEALELGELTEHAEIEALVERAWRARVESFGDSTDMCSLVNAKSGGCAEDCGFCAQSRYADADTPMHAMMEPEQILEHAQARPRRRAPTASAWSPRARGSPSATSRRSSTGRGWSPSTPTSSAAPRSATCRPSALGAARGRRPARAPQRRVGRELLPGGLHDGPLRGPAADDRGGPRGGPRDLRRRHPQPRRDAAQRVEMAFELSEINPTRVPINLLIPRAGTKFGERELMDRGRP